MLEKCHHESIIQIVLLALTAGYAFKGMIWAKIIQTKKALDKRVKQHSTAIFQEKKAAFIEHLEEQIRQYENPQFKEKSSLEFPHEMAEQFLDQYTQSSRCRGCA